jgi:iron(III) transport system ATP-binding protein
VLRKQVMDTARIPGHTAEGDSGRRRGGVRVAGLSRSFSGNRVVDDVSFEVPEGTVCAILGASGSGKTTTLRLLAGLDRPDCGEIWIGGDQVAGDRMLVPAEKRDVGMVFQAYALWPHMKVFDQIAYPLRVRHRARGDDLRKAVTESATMVGLEDLLDRYPSELSGGQQQRVALARALVFGPRVLLLDEPLSGLDAALRRRTRQELEDLQRRVSVTTIYVTHDQEEAMAVADLVVVMANGRVISMATPRDTYDRPNSAYIASFVGSSNLLRGTVASTSDGDATVRLADGICVRGVTNDRVHVAEPVILAVKPVDVVVEPEPARGENTLLAEVLSVTYLGAHVEVVARVSDAEFRIPVQRTSTLCEGDKILVHLPPNRLAIVPDRGQQLANQ